jgi:hypothetical protein
MCGAGWISASEVRWVQRPELRSMCGAGWISASEVRWVQRPELRSMFGAGWISASMPPSPARPVRAACSAVEPPDSARRQGQSARFPLPALRVAFALKTGVR